MAEKQKWPPIDWLWKQHAINGAWYSGDELNLRKYTTGFWRTDEKHKTHIPIAADLAALAAGFLFSGSPTITHENESTNERLQSIMEQAGFYQKLLQSAELQSAFGGVFVKLNWDTSLVQYPIVTVVPGNAGLPEYRHDVLNKCTFWFEVKYDEETGDVYRLEERYERDGHIYSRLMKGNSTELGKEIPLDTIDETKGVKPNANSGTGRLMAVYIPNRLPNRLNTYVRYGASDYEGMHGLFSSLDEAYSSLMRDVRLSKTRVIVPMEFLRRKETIREKLDQTTANTDLTFTDSDEVFVALDINPNDSGAGITVVQSAIRAQDHMTTIEDIIRKIYMMAGFAPQSAGIDIVGQSQSGTALNIRERRSIQTAETKKTYWWHSLVDFVEAMMLLDSKVFNTPYVDGKITVKFADNTQPDMQTMADTLMKLVSADVTSTETRVRMLWPEMKDADILAEVKRIKIERGEDMDDEPPDPEMGDMSVVVEEEPEEEPGGDE